MRFMEGVKGMEMDRRGFVGSVIAFGALGAFAASIPRRRPDLVFGVVSDIHLTTPESCGLLERSFRYFRARGVDAVMIPGDLSDYGTKGGWLLLKRTWDGVFAGTDTVPLFCTGNHDFEGWWYGDMVADMLANGYDGQDAAFKLGIEHTWEEVFGERYEPIRVRTVKGYDFLSVEYGSEKELAAWMDANGARFRGDRPFFHFQHVPAQNTTADSFGRADGGVTKPVLERFRNCVSFTGHTHRPFTDERSIWQGEYTSVSVPSLASACVPGGYENGGGRRDGKATEAMPPPSYRFEGRGGQGYVVSVYRDEMVIERRDLEENAKGAAAWRLPLPVGDARPYAFDVRERVMPAPAFPSGATLSVTTANTENRQGKWVIALVCRFPSAKMPDGSRVYDYEIRAVPTDGSAPLVKRFVSPAFAKLPKYEPAVQCFWFDTKLLPVERDFVIEVCARNCFGKCGKPLVSAVRRVLAAERVPRRGK